jgi:hypothetical protein
MIRKWKQYVIEVTIAASSIGDNGYKIIQKITTYDIDKNIVAQYLNTTGKR